MALLLREAIGAGLRRARTTRRRTLRDVSRRARVSLGYLSEVERGRKEPSSEMIAALAGALDITVAELMAGTAEDLRRAAIVLSGTVVGTAATAIRPAGQRPSGPVALAMAA